MTAARLRRRALWGLAIGTGIFAGSLIAFSLFVATAPADVPLRVDTAPRSAP